MAAQAPAMTACPFCEEHGSRREIHAHMVERHPDRMEAWSDAATGRMRYRVECPACGDDYERAVKPRLRDPSFLEEFAREVRLVAFDMLLAHFEAEHDAEPAPQAAPEALPAAGPAGGIGRPGAAGVPLPPGMAPGDVEPPAVWRTIEEHRRKEGR